MDTISIAGLDKAEVLAALYNNARPLDMGFLQYNPAPMDVEEARQTLQDYSPCTYFEYLHGRVMKVELSEDDLRTFLYDRDNGQGAAERVITELRKG